VTSPGEVRRLAAQLAADVPAGQVGAFLRAALNRSWPFEHRLPVHNPTLDVLELFAGHARNPRPSEPRPAVAATARAAIAATTARV
jgi:hypothetical protein